jgi:putative endopeptidase
MVDGELTLRENIADLGAMQCLSAIIGEGNTEGIRQCYTNLALCFRVKARKNYYQMLLTNVHSPNPVRVDGLLSSMDAFYTAFDVQPGDGMYVAPEDRVGIW